MTRNVTCKGGPLHGKTYTVPSSIASFPADGGTYKVGPKQATWHAADDPDTDLGDALEALAASTAGQADR